MKPSPDSLTRLIEKARTAPPPETEETLLSPGAATRIAARWAAERPGISPGVLWDRLSYAGLAVALLTGAAAFYLKPPAASATSTAATTGAETLPDLFTATIIDNTEG